MAGTSQPLSFLAMVGDLLQPTHLLFVLVVALLVLGPKRLPEVGRALGRGLRDFRHAMSGEEQSEAIPPATGGSATPPSEPASGTMVRPAPAQPTDQAPAQPTDQVPVDPTDHVPEQPTDQTAPAEPVAAATSNAETQPKT